MEKNVLLFGIIAIILIGSAVFMFEKPSLTSYPPQVIQEFQQFLSKYNKLYSDPDLFAYRLGVFYQNYQKIQAFNAEKHSWYQVVNQFTDLTQEEFEKYYLGFIPESDYVAPESSVMEGSDYADIDHVAAGRVTQIKDQGQCGSCWAFSTTGALEGLCYKSRGLSLSEQQLVDCSILYGNLGCNGGKMDRAFNYVKAKGITDESTYPYTAKTGKCHYDKSTAKYQNTGHVDVKRGNTDDLYSKLQVQPVAIAVDASQWSSYGGGIMSNCGTSLDHGVLLVGYKNNGGNPYWVVKNSWGPSWGQNGFIYLKAPQNTCGLANSASVPTGPSE